jgi:uncharacterized FlaG/YvyC family protein
MDNVHFNDKVVSQNQQNPQLANQAALKGKGLENKDAGKSIVQKKADDQKQKEQELQSKIDEFNLNDKNVKIQFKLDETSGERYIELRDQGSDKVIRRIPSETMMKIAQNIEDFIDINNDKGLAVDENA